MELRALREKRAALVDRMHGMLDRADTEDRALSEDEKRTYRDLEAELRKLSREIGDEEIRLDEERDELEREVNDGRPARRSGPVAHEDDPMGPRRSYGRAARRTRRHRRFTDPQGREIRALEPDESLERYVVEERGASLPDNARADEFDVGKVIRGMVLGRWEGAELEQRAMSGSDFTKGGALLPELPSARIIDLARAQARVMQAGAPTIPLDGSSLRIARIDGDVTAYWRHENVPITPSDASIGGIELQPKTLAALTPVSQELVEDASNIGQVVEGSIAAAIGLELDRATLFGNDSGAIIMGIDSWPGVQQVAGVGQLTSYTDLQDAWGLVIGANGPERGLAAIHSTREAVFYDKLVDGDGQWLTPPPSIANGVRMLPTTQIPTTGGGGADESSMFVGDFSQVFIGMRTRLMIEAVRGGHEASTGLGFGSMTIWIRGYTRADVAMGRTDHMVHLSGITP